jgi:ABC-type sugar transport system ATPase subunit
MLGRLVDRKGMERRAMELLGRIGVSIDVRQAMRRLSTAQEQLVQIASAVGTGANILVFDEPTSSLSQPESESLFRLIEQLKSRGVTMIYVSHRMPEVFRLCDRVTVLRDGHYVGTLDRAAATPDAVIRMMIGRSIEAYFPQHLGQKAGPIILSAKGLSSPGQFHDVSFDVRAGEIVGFAGLVGAGRSEVAKAIFGLDKRATGMVMVNGQRLRLGRVKDAMRSGLGLVPEDRKRQGLVLMMGGRQNFSLAMLERMRRLWVMIDTGRERRMALDYFEKLRVKTQSLEMPVAGLSGGNQQKVALAKWLGRGAKLLIVDEPTRGVDVGAKAAIHALIDNLAREGAGIMLISSELPELLNLSTRVLVMREGRLVAELPREELSQERVVRYMAGVAEAAA